MTRGFCENNVRLLSRSEKALLSEKDVIKTQRRKLTLCLRRVNPETAIEKRAWFHLSNNMAMSMTYNLRHINEVCKEHVDNNFRPLPSALRASFGAVCAEITSILRDSAAAMDPGIAASPALSASASASVVRNPADPETLDALRDRCTMVKDRLSYLTRYVYDLLQGGDTSDMTVAYVYLNVLQETQEFITSLRKLLRATGKLNLLPAHYRSFSHHSTPA